MAACAPAGQNRHLVHAFDVFHRPCGKRVPAFMVSGDLLLVLGDDLRASTRPTDNAVGRFFERVGGDDVAVHTRGE